MERESMVFYRSWYEAILKLPIKKRDLAFKALFEYALNGEEVELPTELTLMLDVCKAQIDVNNKRFTNGQKGGRPKAKTAEKKPSDNQTVTKPKPNHNQTITKPKPNENVYVNENENVNVNENVCVNENGVGFSGGSADTPETHTTEKPDVDEVIQAAAAFGVKMSDSEAKDFLAYNDASGWKLEWKYALKRWIQQEKQKPREKPKLKNDVSERHVYDMDELRKRAKA